MRCFEGRVYDIQRGGWVACFAEGRMGYREWARRNGRLGDIHSLDDRLDHDIDELMG